MTRTACRASSAPGPLPTLWSNAYQPARVWATRRGLAREHGCSRCSDPSLCLLERFAVSWGVNGMVWCLRGPQALHAGPPRHGRQRWRRRCMDAGPVDQQTHVQRVQAINGPQLYGQWRALDCVVTLVDVQTISCKPSPGCLRCLERCTCRAAARCLCVPCPRCVGTAPLVEAVQGLQDSRCGLPLGSGSIGPAGSPGGKPHVF